MMQGDSYSLPVEILNSNKETVTAADVSNVEIVLGTLRKSSSDGQITYDEESKKWKFPLTQEETFQILPAMVPAQLRVCWPNGEVEGCSLGYIHVLESLSKEVL